MKSNDTKKTIAISLSAIMLLNSAPVFALDSTAKGDAQGATLSAQPEAGAPVVTRKSAKASTFADLANELELDANLRLLEKLKGQISTLKTQKDSIDLEKDPVLKTGMYIKLGLDGLNLTLAEKGKTDPKAAKERGFIILATSIVSLSIDIYKKLVSGEYNSLTQTRIDLRQKLEEMKSTIKTSEGVTVPREILDLNNKIVAVMADIDKADKLATDAKVGDWISHLTNAILIANSVAHIVFPAAAKETDAVIASVDKMIFSRSSKVVKGAKHNGVTSAGQGASIVDIIAKAGGYNDKDVQAVLQKAQATLEGAISEYEKLAARTVLDIENIKAQGQK